MSLRKGAIGAARASREAGEDIWSDESCRFDLVDGGLRDADGAAQLGLGLAKLFPLLTNSVPDLHYGFITGVVGVVVTTLVLDI